jgi:hypothetical protein
VALVERVLCTYDLMLALSVIQLSKLTWYDHQNQKQTYRAEFPSQLPWKEGLRFI